MKLRSVRRVPDAQQKAPLLAGEAQQTCTARQQGLVEEQPAILWRWSPVWGSLSLNCRPLTFCSHSAGDRGAELHRFPCLQNLWSASHISVAETLQPGSHVAGGPLKSRLTASAAASLTSGAEGFYRVGWSTFAEAAERYISLITLYFRPGFVIQWEQEVLDLRVLQRHCKNVFEVNLYDLRDLTFNPVYPSRLAISSHQTFITRHTYY